MQGFLKVCYRSSLSSTTRLYSSQSADFLVKNAETNRPLHVPVMLNQVIKYLVDDVTDFKVYLDMTFGAGGHTRAILDKNPQAKVYALDRDPSAFELAKDLSLKYQNRVTPMLGKFSDVSRLLTENNVAPGSLDAALIDCGVSSIQFDSAHRGFSLNKDGPLDMRMSSNREPGSITAEDVINKLDEESLGKIIWRYGEERLYKKIAHGIVYFRDSHGPIKTTKQLADVIASTVRDVRTDSLDRPAHIATKTFQALRIFVNNELNELYNAINQIHTFLRPNGRLAVISFHSLEDRIVKSHFNEVDLNLLGENESDRKGADEKRRNKLSSKMKMNSSRLDMDSFAKMVVNSWEPLSRKVILPDEQEIRENTRSRSAKLRVAAKTV